MSTVQVEGLWQFIQTMSLSNRNKQWLADRLIESKTPSVSPSHDEWFEDKENMRMLNEAIAQSSPQQTKEFSAEEIDKLLGYGI